ncbi:MAG TPA: NAD(P)-binding protein, partial [Burkholderiaceae bacterium]
MSGGELRRRTLLAGAAGLPLAGCSKPEPAVYTGGWVGANVERGHRFREATLPNAGALPAPALRRRVGVLVVGAGVAGLAAARALAQRGVDDVHVV